MSGLTRPGWCPKRVQDYVRLARRIHCDGDAAAFYRLDTEKDDLWADMTQDEKDMANDLVGIFLGDILDLDDE